MSFDIITVHDNAEIDYDEDLGLADGRSAHSMVE